MKQNLSLAILLILAVLAGTREVKAQFTFQERPLGEVLTELHKHTGYLILYREPQVQGIKITFSADSTNVFHRLKGQLLPNGLDLIVDDKLKQVVLFRNRNKPSSVTYSISGQVLDAETGERLPFATVIWGTGNDLSGVSANEAGYFNIEDSFNSDQIRLQASYVGYEKQALVLNLDNLNNLDEINFRLEQTDEAGSDLLITGFYQYTENESTRNTVDIGSGTVLGESNTIKALQRLPAVNLTASLSDEMNIRGSPSDAFRVTLDGITIYKQTHLFGLFDNFNADALHTNSLYYDITPAEYQSPGGGVLGLVTRTGSLNDYRFSAGLSNTSVKATAEGPLAKGKSSFLISGRGSFADDINWLGNRKLINWGLDIDRKRKVLSDSLADLNADLVKTGKVIADFGDLHSRLYHETPGGTRWILSGYYGFDDIRTEAERLYRSFNSGGGSNVEYRPVSSKNAWNIAKGSVQMHTQLGGGMYSKTSAAISILKTDFLKDDFTYTQLNEESDELRSFTSALNIESILNEFKFSQDMEHSFAGFENDLGFSYQYFSGEYYEDSFLRPSFFRQYEVHKIDAYLATNKSFGKWMNINAGLRSHYYTDGEYLHWSPRVRVRLFPESLIGLGGGYSRNYQYANKIKFSNVLSSDVWVLASENQPPSSVEQFTAGLYLNAGNWLLFQAEAYLKDFDNLRLHEISTFSTENVFNESPWFTDNTGEAKGLEFLLINTFSGLEINQSYTISKVELQNPRINEGLPFAADWDRRYQYAGTVRMQWIKQLSTTISYFRASGSPNKLAVFGAAEQERLNAYSRLDFSIEYHQVFNSGRTLSASVNVYNLLDTKNEWYREQSFALQQNSNGEQFVTVPVSIYDLGLQPSFSLKVEF